MNLITTPGGATVDTNNTRRLTSQQIEAMDDTMKFDARKVLQMHRPNELAGHFAPGVIDGPQKRDMGSVYIKALIALVIVLAGIAAGAFMGTKFTGWLSSIDWTPLVHLGGKQ